MGMLSSEEIKALANSWERRGHPASNMAGIIAAIIEDSLTLQRERIVAELREEANQIEEAARKMDSPHSAMHMDGEYDALRAFADRLEATR